MITLVAALDEGGAIGNENGIPWDLPEDFAHFKSYTMGKTLIMGRKTFESIGRPLPGRSTIVVTSSGSWTHPGVQTAASLEEALLQATGEEIIIAGGAMIYTQALPIATDMVLSMIEGLHPGDTFFPVVCWDEWKLVDYDQRSGFRIDHYTRRTSE